MRLSKELIRKMAGQRGSSVSSYSGSGSGGGISIADVDALYVSKEYFNRLFTVHGDGNTVVSPNDTETDVSSIEALTGLWTNSFISALGQGGGGGGGGASVLSDLLDVNLGTLYDGQALVYDSATGKWVNGSVTPDLTGYATQQWVQSQGYLTSGAISDMATKTWISQQGYLTSSALNGYATQQWVQSQGYLTSSAISDMATKTWVGQQGYLTSHQTVSGTFWGQSWNNGGTVSGNISNVGNIGSYNYGSVDGFQKIELTNSSSSNNGGAIYFHYNGVVAYASSYIIEDASRVLNINSAIFASYNGNVGIGTASPSHRLHVYDGGLRIGDVVLTWDSTNNALKLTKNDGTAVNLYVTGGVTALF